MVITREILGGTKWYPNGIPMVPNSSTGSDFRLSWHLSRDMVKPVRGLVQLITTV